MNYEELTRWPIGHNSIEVVVFEDGLKRVYFRNGEDAYQLAGNLAELDTVITSLQKARARFEHPCAICRAWAEDDEEQEKPTTLYNWSNAPDWAMWAATDEPKEDGTRKAWWCLEKPKLYKESEWGNRTWEEMSPADILHNYPAADSLEKRPD